MDCCIFERMSSGLPWIIKYTSSRPFRYKLKHFWPPDSAPFSRWYDWQVRRADVTSLHPISRPVARIRLVVYFDGFLCVHVTATLGSFVHVINPQPGTRLHLSTWKQNITRTVTPQIYGTSTERSDPFLGPNILTNSIYLVPLYGTTSLLQKRCFHTR